MNKLQGMNTYFILHMTFIHDDREMYAYNTYFLHKHMKYTQKHMKYMHKSHKNDIARQYHMKTMTRA